MLPILNFFFFNNTQSPQILLIHHSALACPWVSWKFIAALAWTIKRGRLFLCVNGFLKNVSTFSFCLILIPTGKRPIPCLLHDDRLFCLFHLCMWSAASPSYHNVWWAQMVCLLWRREPDFLAALCPQIF